MRIENDILYADEGKVIDFAEPKFAVNDEKVIEQVHLYADYIKIAKFDKPENYIEVDKPEVE